MVTLFALAVLCEWAVRELVISYRPRFPWVGIFIAFEWHFAWAAMSGMETLLHGLIVTTVLVLLMTNSPRYLTLGLLTGLSVWVRPDGLTLLGPVLMTILFTGGYTLTPDSTHTLSHWLWLPLPLLFIVQPCCWRHAHAEHLLCQAGGICFMAGRPILTRSGQMSLQLLAGQASSDSWHHRLAGEINQAENVGRSRRLGLEAGYLILYISRLPVYQHGRYIMPAMPIFFCSACWLLPNSMQGNCLPVINGSVKLSGAQALSC